MTRRLALCLSLGLAACPGREDCPQPTPKPLEAQRLGEPCGAKSNCQDPLACRAIYAVPGFTSPSFTANACTVACDGGTNGCPTAAVCAHLAGPLPDGGTVEFDTCLPACTDDAQCRAGTSAGVCVLGHCERLQCKTDPDCPIGFACEIPAVVCCPSNAHCPYAGPVPGYCRAVP